jgi:signal transduction histidine kinase
MKTRTYLFLMAGAILLPVAIASWIGLSMLLDWERESRLRSVREMARATAFQIDREVAAAEAMLRSVAHSEGMRQRDYARLHRWTSTTNAGNKQSWTVLSDSQGRMLFSTQAPLGTRFGTAPRAWASQVTPAGGTRVSGYFLGEYSKRPVVSVSVPAPLDDGQYNIVSQIFDVRYFERILRHDAISEDWKVGIFDRNGLAIMRNRDSTMLGQPMQADFLAAARASSHGVFRYRTSDNAEVYGVYTRSKTTDWTVVIGVPVAQIEAAARTATFYAALVLVLLLGLAVAIVLYLGRTLERALSQAAAAVTLLADGAIALPARTRVVEVDALVAGLSRTSEALARERRVRQSLQDEREQLLVSEQHARRVAEAQSRAKDDFLAMLGHELRNPLAAISGAMQVLDMPNLKPHIEANAREISRRQMRHLTCIVDDLLDVQRILSGKIVLHRARVDLAAIVRGSAEAKALVDGGQHIWSIETTADAWVDGDRTRLEQIVDNLLHNAIKYTPKGGRVSVRVWLDGDTVVVEVSDTGVGIAPELQPVIFDVLVQGPMSIDRGQGGLGLGLALVRQLTALHGGTVAVHSDGAGKGSSFVVRFPAHADQDGGAAQRLTA